MATNDEGGWGAIYGSTWWGSGDAFTNQIGWGSAMFYILAPAQFRGRVEADGGELTGFNCISKVLRRLPQADDGRIAWEAYESRVLADGGTLTSRTCTINEINALKAI